MTDDAALRIERSQTVLDNPAPPWDLNPSRPRAMAALFELLAYDNMGVRVSMRGCDLVVGDRHDGYRELTPAEEAQVCRIFARRAQELEPTPTEGA